MQVHMMKNIGISLDEISKSRIVIQGFNQKGQHIIGKIRIKIKIGEMNSSTLRHIIEAKTYHGLLLERTCLHENGVVPSMFFYIVVMMKSSVLWLQKKNKKLLKNHIIQILGSTSKRIKR